MDTLFNSFTSSPKFLLMCMSGIGNTIMFSPVISTLRKTFPSSYIVLLTTERGGGELWKKSGLVDRIEVLKVKGSVTKNLSLLFKLRKERFNFSFTAFPSNRIEYNLVSFLIGAKYRVTHGYKVGRLKTLAFLQNRRIPAIEGIHDVEQNMNLIKTITKEKNNQKNVTIQLKEEEEKVEWVLKKEKIGKGEKLIGLSVSIHYNFPYKRWAEDIKSTFAKVGDFIQQKMKKKVILIGAKDEKNIVKEIEKQMSSTPVKWVGKDLVTTTALIKRCALIINTDSGIGHIASLVGTPSITIFGPSDYRRSKPFGERHLVVRKNLTCSPCYSYPFRGTKMKIKCKKRECMKGIQAEEIITKVRKILDGKNGT